MYDIADSRASQGGCVNDKIPHWSNNLYISPRFHWSWFTLIYWTLNWWDGRGMYTRTKFKSWKNKELVPNCNSVGLLWSWNVVANRANFTLVGERFACSKPKGFFRSLSFRRIPNCMCLPEFSVVEINVETGLPEQNLLICFVFVARI